MMTSPAPAIRRERGALSFTGFTVAGVAAAAVLGAVSPEQPGHYPTCPFLAMTGFWCPGCGALRAVHALVVGDPATALDRNPLLVVLLPLLGLAWLGWGLRVAGSPIGWRLHPTRIPVAAVWTLFGVIAVYWVARNVPGWTWLSPA